MNVHKHPKSGTRVVLLGSHPDESVVIYGQSLIFERVFSYLNGEFLENFHYQLRFTQDNRSVRLWEPSINVTYLKINVFDHSLLHILGHKPVVQCAPIENSSNLNTSDVAGNVRVEYRECVVVMYRNVTNGTTLRQEIPCPSGYQYDVPRDRSLVTEVLTFGLNIVVAIDHGHVFCN